MAQIDAARKFCLKYKQNLILKGAYSAVVTSDGGVHFNTTGNPGMATAGSGDVLCGVVLGLLSQGMRGDEAAVLAAYLHGLAGDKAAETHGEVSLMAGDIAECLCQAFLDF
jgi:NAD(P)H-hydrate epimerase